MTVTVIWEKAKGRGGGEEMRVGGRGRDEGRGGEEMRVGGRGRNECRGGGEEMRVGGRGRDEGRGGDEGVPVIAGGWRPVPKFPFVSSAPHSTVGEPGGMWAQYFILPYTHSPIPMSHHHVVEHVESQHGLGTAGIWLTPPPPPHSLPSILALCSESTTLTGTRCVYLHISGQVDSPFP